MKIAYGTIGLERRNAIKPLWEKLNEHHRLSSPHFSNYYERFTFEKRCEKFRNDDLAVRIEVATDDTRSQYAGYCISTIDGNGRGEIDSLFVEEDYRGEGIGDTLVRSALSWFDGEGAAVRSIVVAAGNDEAAAFYERYGFYPAYRTLIQRTK